MSWAPSRRVVQVNTIPKVFPTTFSNFSPGKIDPGYPQGASEGRGQPKTRPKRLVSDKAYDSEALRDKLGMRGIRLLVPHRCDCKKNRRQSP